MLKLKQKEKAYKKMEDLSSEKLAFDDLLVNEKQDLVDQLRTALHQLREMESLYEKERLIKEELENNNIQLEAEKQMNAHMNQEHIDEIVDLKNEMLKLQANYEKDRFLINTMEVKLQEQTEINAILHAEVDENQRKRTQLEAELEDLTNQNLVLLEERDAAQANEEDYFRKLNDITVDLERLQESYVIISDRCNDQSDEIADLRDKVLNLEDLLERKDVSNYFNGNTPNRPTTSSSYQRPTTSNSRLPPPTPESNPYFDDVFVDEPTIKKEKGGGNRLAITDENKRVNEQRENSYVDDDFDDYDNDDFEP
jgi:chromosome segregation ATPase